MLVYWDSHQQKDENNFFTYFVAPYGTKFNPIPLKIFS